MSERMTQCSPTAPANGPAPQGVVEYGRKTRAEMIARYREHYQHMFDEAQAALAVADEDLQVTTYVGGPLNSSYAKHEVVTDPTPDAEAPR